MFIVILYGYSGNVLTKNKKKFSLEKENNSPQISILRILDVRSTNS